MPRPGPLLLFGVGYGMFDANNIAHTLPVCAASHRRASAYGLMNMTGVFMGAAVTGLLGGLVSDGNLGVGFALMGGVVALAGWCSTYIAQGRNPTIWSENQTGGQILWLA